MLIEIDLNLNLTIASGKNTRRKVEVLVPALQFMLRFHLDFFVTCSENVSAVGIFLFNNRFQLCHRLMSCKICYTAQLGI